MEKSWECIYRPNYIAGYNPFIIKNMNKAIERMVEAINHREKIVIYGNCDVDSICGLSSLLLILKYLNADVEYYIEEGYTKGNIISEESLKNHVHFLGAQLLITVGCGFESQKQLDLCEELKIDCIITENRKTKLKLNGIYINPSQQDCSYRHKNLSSCGVAFKLMQAIAIYYNMKSINKYIDLIMLGTVSAKVKDVGESKIFLKEGTAFLKQTNNYGLRAIMDFYEIRDINEDAICDIIKAITPPISTVGKKDNARIVVELLTTNDQSRAEQITKYLYNEKLR